MCVPCASFPSRDHVHLSSLFSIVTCNHIEGCAKSAIFETKRKKARELIVCCTAVFSGGTQRSSLLGTLALAAVFSGVTQRSKGEERCVTTLKTAV